MTPPLPLPVRVAAGLVVTAFEQVRGLPRLALELPVTAVSQALQASMRVQQKVTELAIKGDRVLGVGTPVEDEPPWATFDDDPLPAEKPGRRNGRGAAEPAGRATVTALHRPSDRPAPAAPPADPSDDPGPVDPGSVDPRPVPGVPADTTAGDPTTAGLAVGDPPAGRPGDGPAVLPGYAALTIPQLRGKLRHLGVDDLRTLLEWEHAHGNRPPYVTMLSNRIATLSEQ